MSSCPKGGLLSGTDRRDKLDGEDGDDEIRGLGGDDEVLWGGSGSDVIYGGPGDDSLEGGTYWHGGDTYWIRRHEGSKDVHYGGPGSDVLFDKSGGEDVLYGEDGNDFIDASGDEQRDKLYCGEGKDKYVANKLDNVSSSCEVKAPRSNL